MSLAFTKKTFRYFDEARKHSGDKAWFEANRELYVEGVEVPLTHLVNAMKDRLSGELPGILFSAKKISKPLLRRVKDSDGSVVRENATVSFAEAATSMFEMNPGIYFSVGAKLDDNVVGCGLYMSSARQMRELRPRCYSEYKELHSLLHAKKLLKYWGGLSGERYQRFPKDFDEGAKGAEYVWHKQFFLGKDLQRADVMRLDFIETTVDALAVAVPFVRWLREAVGVYRKPDVR